MKIVSNTGATSCGYNGATYDADEDGIFTLPDSVEGHEALVALRDHGFAELPTDPKEVAKAKAELKAKAKAEADAAAAKK
jgi:hypothetical protein